MTLGGHPQNDRDPRLIKVDIFNSNLASNKIDLFCVVFTIVQCVNALPK